MTEPRQPAGEDGFTLLELLVVMVLALVVVGLPLTLAVSSFVSQNEAASRTATATRVQFAMDRLSRDLRQAVAVSITSPTAPATAVLEVPTRRPTTLSPVPAPTTVTWTCASAGACRRTTSAGQAAELIPGVVAATFTATTLGAAAVPARVDFEVEVGILNEARRASEALEGKSTLFFRNGVDLRNLG